MLSSESSRGRENEFELLTGRELESAFWEIGRAPFPALVYRGVFYFFCRRCGDDHSDAASPEPSWWLWKSHPSHSEFVRIRRQFPILADGRIRCHSHGPKPLSRVWTIDRIISDGAVVIEKAEEIQRRKESLHRL